jgi:predicted double-glycine peptidase
MTRRVQRSMLVAMVSLGLCLVHAGAQSAAQTTTGIKAIRTLKDIRGDGVVRQRWDMSCGAAALSTLLSYDFDDQTPETAVVVWILHRVDAAKVRVRGGFSLLELKRFAQARGYSAEAFSGMSIEELAQQKTSVITPIHIKGFDHFVVTRGIVGDRVVIADPGFGNMTMSVDRFKKVWRDGVVFIVHPPDEGMISNRRLTAASRLLPDESVIARNIQTALPANRLY